MRRPASQAWTSTFAWMRRLNRSQRRTLPARTPILDRDVYGRPISHNVRTGTRKCHNELAAEATACTFGNYFAAMRFDELADKCQSEPQTPIGSACIISPHERFKNAPQRLS